MHCDVNEQLQMVLLENRSIFSHVVEAHERLSQFVLHMAFLVVMQKKWKSHIASNHFDVEYLSVACVLCLHIAYNATRGILVLLSNTQHREWSLG